MEQSLFALVVHKLLEKKKVKSSWKIIIIVLNSFQVESLRPIKDNKIIEDKKEDKIYATRGISHSPSASGD